MGGPFPVSSSSFHYTLGVLSAFLRQTTTFESDGPTRVIDPKNYLHLDQWTVSRLTTVLSPSSVQVLQHRYIVARIFRTDPSQSVDLRLEPSQHTPQYLSGAVPIALDALPSSVESQKNTAGDLNDSSPTPPTTTPSRYSSSITFSLVPSSQVTLGLDLEEEVLYQISTIEERSLTLLSLVHGLVSVPSETFWEDFAQDFLETPQSLNYPPKWYTLANHRNLFDAVSETDTQEYPDDYNSCPSSPPNPGPSIHPTELDSSWVGRETSEDWDTETRNLSQEFHRLSELKLQLATELRSFLYTAEKTAMEVQAFNSRQHNGLEGDGRQVLIDFQEDLKLKQDVAYLIHRLERPAYICGLRS